MHHFGSNERFEVAIRFESILLDSEELPFAAATPAVVRGGGPGGGLRLRPHLTFPASVQAQSGNFVFVGKRLSVPYLDAKWVTQEPEENSGTPRRPGKAEARP